MYVSKFGFNIKMFLVHHRRADLNEDLCGPHGGLHGSEVPVPRTAWGLHHHHAPWRQHLHLRRHLRKVLGLPQPTAGQERVGEVWQPEPGLQIR